MHRVARVSRFLLALAITGAILTPLMLQGRASAISLGTECPSVVRQGNDISCDLTLMIPGEERIPIRSLQLDVSGQTLLRATFGPFGRIINTSVQIKSLELLSEINPGFGYGYGYGYGYLFGSDQLGGYSREFSFGYGYGYGYGYGSQFARQLRYRVVINTSGMEIGNYSAKFVLNTGNQEKSTFESDSASFSIETPGPIPAATPTPAPLATPTPTATQIPVVTQVPTASSTFTQVGSNLGFLDNGLRLDVAWGDYDNDGDLDFYVARDGDPNLLYRKNSEGALTEVAGEAGVADPGKGETASWADYDRDGNLDLYVANFGSENPIPNQLYRNNGDGTFLEVGLAAGVADSGTTLAIAWADYDKDGDQDLFVANRDEGSRLYRNNGDGTFTDVAASSGVTMTTAGDAGWGDYDNDGDLDLFVTAGDCCRAGNPFRNNRNGTFTVVLALGSGVGGVAWGDYDNDGDLDLYQAQGGADVDNLLWRNDGDGTFTDVASEAGVGGGGAGSGAEWFDYDGDGDLDLGLAVATDGTLGRPTTNRLYRNDGVSANFLIVNTVGTTSVRDGIGARVLLVVEGQRQIREVDGGSGLQSLDALPVHFGLGTSTVVEMLEVTWPSGNVQILKNVPANRIITVTEPVILRRDVSGEAQSPTPTPVRTLPPTRRLRHRRFPE